VACVVGAGEGAGAVATGGGVLTSPEPGRVEAVEICDAPPEAATALVLAVDDANAASVRWSAAIVADSCASVRALAAFC
jgi:hypothetical protein